MKLYNFFRSGTSHRLRIALNLKGIPFEYVPVDLRKEAHLCNDYKGLNPQGLVPTLVDGDVVLTQTPAIIEWLEERYPTPALLPSAELDRTRVRALAALVACDVHPLNNRRVLEYLRKEKGFSETDIDTWTHRWIEEGFGALEAMLKKDQTRGKYCFGDSPTLADVYLVPQVESARRFKVDLAAFPTIAAINATCNELPAFRNAAPSEQPDG